MIFFLSSSKPTLNSLLGGDLLPNTEKLCLLKYKNYSVKVFSAIHVCIDMNWLPYRWVWTRLYFQQEQGFSVRAREREYPFLRHFSFNHFYFFFSKIKHTRNYNFFFISSRFLLYIWRWGWFVGNECCPIFTARS